MGAQESWILFAPKPSPAPLAPPQSSATTVHAIRSTTNPGHDGYERSALAEAAQGDLEGGKQEHHDGVLHEDQVTPQDGTLQVGVAESGQDQDGQDQDDQDQDTPFGSHITIHGPGHDQQAALEESEQAPASHDTLIAESWAVLPQTEATADSPSHWTDSAATREGSSQSSTHSQAAEDNDNVWSSVPYHDSSHFFDDGPADDPDEQGSGYPGPLFDDHRHHLARHPIRRNDGEQHMAASIYASVPNVRLRGLNTDRLEPSTASGSGRLRSSEEEEDTDMLSLPSSLSVSDRTTSNSTRSSPRFALHHSGSQLHSEELFADENTALTRAALSRIDEVSALAMRYDISPPQETGLTSGSEDGGESDADERLLSRAPDAISAGIRSVRQRVPLQPLPGAAASQSPLSGGRISAASRDNLSVTSSAKRRHRRAGTSEKGTKRSNQGKGSSTPVVDGAVTSRRPTSRAAPTRPPSTRYRFRDAMRKVFDLDAEMMDLMTQPGSILDQPLPTYAPARRRQSEPHGMYALSAHIASELGETDGVRHLLGAYSEEHAFDSGNETETEQSGYSVSQRQYRGRHQHRQEPVPASSAHHDDQADTSDDDCAHTASLGLHRSMTLASLQHFLLESVYGSLPSSILGSSDPSLASQRDAGSEHGSLGMGRRRTLSHPAGARHTRKVSFSSSSAQVERSHSSSDLIEEGRRPGSGQEGYTQTLSYWRRFLRSLAH